MKIFRIIWITMFSLTSLVFISNPNAWHMLVAACFVGPTVGFLFNKLESKSNNGDGKHDLAANSVLKENLGPSGLHLGEV